MEREALRRPELGRVVAEGGRRLGDADRDMGKSHLFDVLQFLGSRRIISDIRCAVDLFRNGFDLVFQAAFQIIEGVIVGTLINGGEDFFSQIQTAFAAFCKYIGLCHCDADFRTGIFDDLLLFCGVSGEHVQRNNDRQAKFLHVGNMAHEVRKASLDRFRIGFCEFILRFAAIHLERTNGRNKDRRIRL